jgi:hypothetical protein
VTESGQETIPTGARRGYNWRFIGSAIVRVLLPLWFLIYAGLTLRHFAVNDLIGIDLRIYRHAGEVALAGGNPWALEPNVFPFAGPPPTLLLYVPVSLLPLPVATVLMMTVGLAAATWAVRRLGLPLWWLLFPPLFDALIVGNPDALVLPLLLVRGPLAGLAAVLKVYAAVPLLLQRRWAALGVALGVSLISLPLLPVFLSNLGTVSSVLTNATSHLSAWGTWLMLPVIVALFVLRRRGAEWLVVPALWPNTQSQYGTMALPAVHRYPLAAALIGLNTPLLPPIAVIVMAVEEWLRSRRKAVDGLPEQQPPTSFAADGGAADRRSVPP